MKKEVNASQYHHSSRSARMLANRASFYGHIMPKQNERRRSSEDLMSFTSTGFSEVNFRLNKLEEEISSVKDLLRDVHEAFSKRA